MPTLLQPYVTKRTLLGGLVGIVTALTLGYNLGLYSPATIFHHPTTRAIKEVHVHADFRMYIGNTRIRFTDKKYQSEVGHKLANWIHFHDGSDEVIHRHAEGITLPMFFGSLGLSLTDTCVTLDTGPAHCTGKDGILMLRVNGKVVTDIMHYILADNDRVLLYYGDPTNPRLTDYTNGVTNLACLYTGTCPERGKPPTEGCGLTCDVTAHDQSIP